MVLDIATDAGLIACNRFGMGARPGDIAHLGNDPRGGLKAELARADVALIDTDSAANLGLMSTVPNIQAAYAAQERRRIERLQMASVATAIAARAGLPGIGSDAEAVRVPAPSDRRPEQQIYRAEAMARLSKAATAEIGFVERLVAFWSNHFCVSLVKGEIVEVSAGSFEREAIRPNVLGSFTDMVLAVERHPAMLFYLDNTQSIGPASIAGQRQKRGLNENLAREIIELHTLGVGGGYSQGDVTSLARILTGWTMAGREGRQGEPGAFVFNVRAHEPGDVLVVGKAYLQGGLGQGEEALSDLARHPATATHVATKLARHFIADEPPAPCVERLARVFRGRDGDLRALAATLVDMPEAWSTPLGKIRNPYDLTIATMRMTGTVPAEPGVALAALRVLGMPLWEPPGPNGFADVAAEWGSPEGMKQRLDMAAQWAHQAHIGDPLGLLDTVAGKAASDDTRLALSRAESKEQAAALLFMSPEFQRR